MTATKTKPAPQPAETDAAARWQQTMARLDALKPARSTLTVCDDPEVKARLAQAKAKTAAARKALDAAGADAGDYLARKVADAEAELADAQAAYDAAAVVLTFQALGRRELEALQRQYPPTEEGEENGDDYDLDSFAPALISAASVDGMPAEYARHLLDTWSAADANALWQAAWGVQNTTRGDLGKG